MNETNLSGNLLPMRLQREQIFLYLLDHGGKSNKYPRADRSPRVINWESYRLSVREDFLFQGISGQTGNIVDIQLVHNILPMFFDRANA